MTDVQVSPNFKPTISCPCGCGAEGAPRVGKARDGKHHARGCTRRCCTSGQQVKDERKRVRRFAKASGLRQTSGSGRHVGFDLSGVLAVEETSGQELVFLLRRWWDKQSTQDKLERVRNQQRVPWAFLASWDGKPQLAVLSADGLAALALAACGSDMETALALVDKLVEVTFPPCETTGDDE